MTISRKQLNDWYCEYTGALNDGINALLLQNAVSWNKAKRSVLFLDEFNRSQSDILNASLQLILDKRLNDHVLPIVNGQPTLVVAAINPDSSSYSVNSLDPALLDRFLFLEAEVDTKEWLAYARTKGINAIIRDFITENPKKLYFEPADGGTSATPRSWEKLGKFIDIAKDIEDEHFFPIIKGMIGSEIASQFYQFYNTYSKSVKFADIDKLAKSLIKENKDQEGYISLVGSMLAEQITNEQETIQQMETAAQFYDKYIDKKPEQALPLLTYIYSMPLEQAAAFIISTKKDDEGLKKFGALDKLNDKKLLLEIMASAMQD